MARSQWLVAEICLASEERFAPTRPSRASRNCAGSIAPGRLGAEPRSQIGGQRGDLRIRQDRAEARHDRRPDAVGRRQAGQEDVEEVARVLAVDHCRERKVDAAIGHGTAALMAGRAGARIDRCARIARRLRRRGLTAGRLRLAAGAEGLGGGGEALALLAPLLRRLAHQGGDIDRDRPHIGVGNGG